WAPPGDLGGRLRPRLGRDAWQGSRSAVRRGRRAAHAHRAQALMRGVFVTGTDTGVGKTLFATALLMALGRAGIRAAACKPVAAGCRREGGRLVNADAELLAAAAPVEATLQTVNPVALEPAVAPHIAAAEAGILLDPAQL